MTLGAPDALWALGLALLVPLLARRSRAGLSRGRLVGALASRAISLAALALALADPRIDAPTEGLDLALVVDARATIDPAARAALDASTARLTPGSTARVRRVEAPTDLASRIGVAVATPLPRRRTRVLVATDGRTTGPALPLAVEAAREAGAVVDVWPLGDDDAAPRIEGLELPRLVRPGESLDVGVRVVSAAATDARLVARIDGREVAARVLRIERAAAMHALTLRVPEAPGLRALSVTLEAVAPDAAAQSPRWEALVEVQAPPRALVLHDPSIPAPPLAAVLRDAGMEVRLASPDEAPDAAGLAPLDLVILDEVDPTALPPAAAGALRAWVERDGGGLVTVTGAIPIRAAPRSLRDLEPIGPPPAEPEPRPLELMLVMDRSSSMTGPSMVQARRAGIAAVRALGRDALVGAVAFSGTADAVQPPVPMERAAQVEQFVQRLYPSGGTNIAAAISAANRAMSRDPRYQRHVILVSDGESEPQAAIAAAISLAGRGVTISTISIGPSSALLAEIARVGRGRYHATSAAGLASLLVAEAVYRQPPAQRTGAFVPRVRDRLPMLDGVSFEGAPSIAGHTLGSAREGAAVGLTARGGAPLLAHWRRGEGQVATFAGATSGRWADGLRESPLFRAMWSAIARGMRRHRVVSPPSIALRPAPLDPDALTVRVVAPGLDAAPAPIARLADRAADDAWTPLPLAAVGPGIFEARVPRRAALLVDARMPEDPAPTAAVGDERPPARRGLDRAGLARLAALGGGRVLRRLDDALAPLPEGSAPRPLRAPLLGLALAAYLVSLALARPRT